MGNYDFELDLESVNTMSVILQWISNNSQILEFGCANGRLTKYLKEKKNCQITIVEMEEEAGGQAQKYADKSYIGNERGNIENYIWLEGAEKYDFIIFADVLEHLSHPEEVLRKCKKSLSDGGRILISIPNFSHNSIIIDLMNDKFEYDKTGLLDRTHIHFFTYSSFLNMIEKNGFQIRDQQYIYSRVGNNEIKNSYFDVPTDVANYLRERVAGSIYQYVFNLSLMEEEERNFLIEDDRKPFIEDYKESLESQLFFPDSDGVYTAERKISLIYKYRKLTKLRFDVSNLKFDGSVRWDPMEYNVIIRLTRYEVITQNEDRIKMKIAGHNADDNLNNYFIFLSSDPQIIFSISMDNVKETISRVEIDYEILKYRFEKNDEFANQCMRLMNRDRALHDFQKLKNSDISDMVDQQNVVMKSYLEKIESECQKLEGLIRMNERQLACMKKSTRRRKW